MWLFRPASLINADTYCQQSTTRKYYFTLSDCNINLSARGPANKRTRLANSEVVYCAAEKSAAGFHANCLSKMVTQRCVLKETVVLQRRSELIQGRMQQRFIKVYLLRAFEWLHATKRCALFHNDREREQPDGAALLHREMKIITIKQRTVKINHFNTSRSRLYTNNNLRYLTYWFTMSQCIDAAVRRIV